MSAIICAAATMSPCIDYLKNPINHTEPAAQRGIRELRVQSLCHQALSLCSLAPTCLLQGLSVYSVFCVCGSGDGNGQFTY